MSEAPIGTRGIALENIFKDEIGPAYLIGIGEAKVKAVENIKKYSEIIIVDEDNKALELRRFEARAKPWNVYRQYSIAAGQTQEVVKVDGEGELVSIAIYTSGSLQAAKSPIEIYLDKEEKPSLKTSIYELYNLGGRVAPTPNPKGGATVYDTTSNLYGAFLNPEISFGNTCFIQITNADTTATRTFYIYLLFRLRGTETKVWLSAAVEGGAGGDVPPPDKSGGGTVGGGERLLPGA